MIGPATRMRSTWSSDKQVADARQRLEGGGRNVAGEAQLDLVMGQVAQAFDRVELDDLAVADDRDPVAALFDLGQDVARQEDRRAVLDRLAQDR